MSEISLFSKGAKFKVAVGECHRCTDLKKVSVTLLDETPKAFPMSLFLFPSTLTPGIKFLNGERSPALLGLAGAGLSTPAASSPVFTGGASTSPQPSVRYLIHIWPYHQYLGFPLDGFRKLSAQGDDALNVSSTLSGAESSQVGIILLSNICCIFTGAVHRTKIVLILWDRFLDFYHFVSTPKRLEAYF